jgi:hypothetical protein
VSAEDDDGVEAEETRHEFDFSRDDDCILSVQGKHIYHVNELSL